MLNFSAPSARSFGRGPGTGPIAAPSRPGIDGVGGPKRGLNVRRPNWPQSVPPLPKTDEFGLQIVSLLGQALEAPEEKAMRSRRVRRSAFRAYRAVALHLGDEEAKKIFEGFISKARRMGRPGGSSDPSRDEVMLEVYDALATGATEAQREALPRTLGELLEPEFGNSDEARVKHIRRLLRWRERRRALDVARYRRLTGGADFPKTLLGELVAQRDTK